MRAYLLSRYWGDYLQEEGKREIIAITLLIILSHLILVVIRKAMTSTVVQKKIEITQNIGKSSEADCEAESDTIIYL